MNRQYYSVSFFPAAQAPIAWAIDNLQTIQKAYLVWASCSGSCSDVAQLYIDAEIVISLVYGTAAPIMAVSNFVGSPPSITYNGQEITWTNRKDFVGRIPIDVNEGWGMAAYFNTPAGTTIPVQVDQLNVMWALEFE